MCLFHGMIWPVSADVARFVGTWGGSPSIDVNGKVVGSRVEVVVELVYGEEGLLFH